MDSKEFKRLYVGEFKPDPVVDEIVAFLRYAKASEIAEWKREGLLPKEELKQAKRILDRESNSPQRP